MAKAKKESDTESAIPNYLQGFGSSLFAVPIRLSEAEVNVRKTQCFDLMAAAAEMAEESERLGSQKSAVDKILKDKQADARRIAHEAKTAAQKQDVDCVRVPIPEEGLVALRRPDKRGMPLVALFDLSEDEAETAAQGKVSKKAQEFITETARLVAELDERKRAELYR